MLLGMNQAHALAFENSLPWFVTIELGLQCNLTCSHCYNFDRSQKPPEDYKTQIPTERILTLIDEIKEAGGMTIAFSGGEALLYPDLMKLIKRTRQNNLLPKLKTNGTLITDKVARELADNEIYQVDVSLYGANSSEHDFLTNKKGSFEKTIDGIKSLRKYKISTKLNFIIHQKNFRSIESMLELAQSLDCESSIGNELTQRYDKTHMSKDVALTYDQYRALLQSNAKSYFKADNSEKNLQCECARTVCGINSKGDVYPCIGAPIFSGNILSHSFLDIWKNSKELNQIRNLKKEDFKTCQNCDLLTFCSRSSGSAYVNTGLYTGPNPENCMEAKARKETLSF